MTGNSLIVEAVRIGRENKHLVSGESRPSISWKIRTSKTDILQTAYEIEIASDKDFKNILATSGIVKSSSVIQAPWFGTSLKSREKRYVRVRIETSGEWSEWSARAQIEAGLLSNLDWKARPITIENDPGISGLAAPLIFRKEFKITGDVAKARIYVTSYGIFDLTINGKKVSEELLNPGWTSYNKRLPYATYDVASFLQNGVNVITASVADGWYRGQMTWELFRNFYGREIALISQLEISLIDGTHVQVNSDRNWRVSTGKVQSADLYEGCVIDFRKEHAGWTEVGFDDSKWEKAKELRVVISKLYPISTPPIRVIEQITPVASSKSSNGSVIYDFGQNLTGYLELKVKGKSGDRIFVTHAEVLKNGNLHRGILRHAKAEDEYFLSDSTEKILTPEFTFHGFRFAQLDLDPGVEVSSVKALVIHSDITAIGTFECSHAGLNKLHLNISWSQRGNYISVPTDCPQRDERLGWTGDAQAFAPAASTLFDSESFLANWLVDLALDQFPDGAVSHIAPDILPVMGAAHSNVQDENWESPGLDRAAGRAGWSDAATIVPWSLYEAYGDLETLNIQYASMYRHVEYLESRSHTDNLLAGGEFQFGDWLDPDAPVEKPWAAKCDSLFIANAFYSYSAKLLARTATKLDKKQDSIRFAALGEEVAKATWNKWQADLLTTATGCAVAIELEVAPPNEVMRIGNALAQLVEKAEGKISTGFLGTPLVMPALSHSEHHDVAYLLLLNEQMPGWLYQIKMGATTMWERWNGINPDGSMPDGSLADVDESMLSFNHYAYGAVAAWMYRTLAGISPTIEKPGYEEINFAPKPSKQIKWAKASVQTRFGYAAIDWHEIKNDEYEINIVVPPGSIGWFISPKDEGKMRLGSGFHNIKI